MPTVSSMARVTGGAPTEGGDIARNAWYLWKSVAEECRRNGATRVGDHFIYEHPLRGHLLRLWPMLTDDERRSFERVVYGFLRSTEQAVCVRKQNPTVWHVKTSWGVEPGAVVAVPIGGGSYRQTRAEARLTEHEAGEDLPPGEVTVRRKEQAVPNPNPAAALADRHAELARLRDQRRSDILTMLDVVTEPLVAQEIAHFIGCDSTTARVDIASLVDAGVVFAREETAEERAIRFGGTAAARRSTLYSIQNPVPPRTEREPVSGYRVSLPENIQVMSKAEIDRRLFCKLKKKGPRSRFTIIDLAESAGTGVDTTRVRIRTMEKAGAVREVGKEGARAVFTVVSKDKVREFFGQLDLDVSEPTKPEDVVVVKTPQPASEVDVEAVVHQIIEENTKLRARVTELEAELEALKNPPAPALSEETRAALTGWTPILPQS